MSVKGMTVKLVSLFTALTIICFVHANTVTADLIPPGYHAVDHTIVFVDSELLKQVRIIAAPVAGFGGAIEIEAGVPFSFSSKYGTRIYLVPQDAILPTRFMKPELPEFPSCPPPVHEINYLPFYNPITSVVSTCKLVEANENKIVVELLGSEEKGSLGFPLNQRFGIGGLVLISGIGFLGCVLIWRNQRRTNVGTDESGVEE